MIGHPKPGPLFAIFLVSWAGLCASASAQRPDSTPAPEDEVATELAVSQAVADFEGGRFQELLRRLEPIESLPIVSYYRGLALAGLNRPAEAIRQFEMARGGVSVPPEVEYDLGVAQLSANDLTGAQASFESYLADHPADPHAHYFLGFALMRQGRRDDALDHLQKASTDQELAQQVDRYLAAEGQARSGSRRNHGATGSDADVDRFIDGGPAASKRWNLTFLTAYQYDSNVPIAPNVSGLGTTDQADSQWVNALFGDYRLVQRDDWNLGLIGAALVQSQFDLDQFDVQNYMGGAYTNLAVGDLIFGVNYQFHETLLDAHQFSTEHRLVPSITCREGEFGHSTVYYEYDRSDFQGAPALIPAQERSGNVHAVGVTQAFYMMEGAGRFYLGYRFEDANTEGSDFDRHTHMVTGRVEFPLPCQLVADAEVRYFWDDYEHPNSLDFFERPRDDRRVEVRAGLQRFLSKHVSLRLDYTFVDSDSNVTNLFGTEFYSYDRHIVSTQLIIDF